MCIAMFYDNIFVLGYTAQKPVSFPEYTDLWDLPSSVISDKRHMITCKQNLDNFTKHDTYLTFI